MRRLYHLHARLEEARAAGFHAVTIPDDELAALLDVADAAWRESPGCRSFVWEDHPTRKGMRVARDCGECSGCLVARLRGVTA